jgi:heterodisulfide reductase subunit B
MVYLYYPGCSLKGTGRAYEESLLAVFKALDEPLQELDDWNCCGATAYMAVDEMKAFALAARNLALAEAQMSDGNVTMVVPCNACYLVLMKTQQYMQEYAEVGKKLRGVLEKAGLHYEGKVVIRHPLDVLVNDIGLEHISKHIKRSLGDLPVAAYYGCQMVRPYCTFDDQHNPMSMDKLVKALGAVPVDWPLKTRCCGGALTGTIEEVGVRLNYILLREAQKRGAQVMATACPLCQFNLECYQGSMNRQYEEKIHVTPVYFSQLMGIAFGLSRHTLGLHRSLVAMPQQLAI